MIQLFSFHPRDCLTVTIDGTKRTNYLLQVFTANNISA